MREKGRDVLSLSVGEPDFDTPLHIREAAKQAIDDGLTRYTAVGGTADLKAAICRKFARDASLEYKEDEVIATSGGKFLIFAAMMATLRPGDEVIIPAPYWVSYPDIVRFAGGVPVIVETTQEEGLVPTAEKLEEAITPKTRWLILNSPNNPSGAVISEDRLKEIGELLMRHPEIWVLTDDIYEHISYDASVRTLPSILPALKDRALVVNGCSKAYAMTGWRLGFGAGPAELISAMVKLAGQSTSNPCSITQAAGVAALNGDHGFLKDWTAAFRTRRDMVVEKLNEIAGVSALTPGGAFYVFPSISGLLGSTASLSDDKAFCEALLEKEGVATVPGSAFGMPGFIRLSYAASTEVLEEGLSRMARFASELG